MRHSYSDLYSFLKTFAKTNAVQSESGHAGRAEFVNRAHLEDPINFDWQQQATLQEGPRQDETSEAAQGLTESGGAIPSFLLLGEEFSFISTVAQYTDADAKADLFTEEEQQATSAAPVDNGRPESSDSEDAQSSETLSLPQLNTSGPITINGRPVDQVPGAPTNTPPSPPAPTDNASNGRPEDAVPDDVGPTILTSYTSGGSAATSYNLEVEFIGTWTAELQASFISAADYLSEMILSDLPDVFVNGQLIDDMVITAELDNIDGVGGILGSAGPTQIRNDGTYLPISGQMTFDSADAQNQLNNGNWEAIILHEMMHTLGLGTLWSLMGLTSGSVAGGDIRFTGENATAIYQTEFPVIAGGDSGSLNGVPVETDGGPGTAGGHWDEFLFDEELMTGFIDAGAYVSEMTIASFEDMGYDTIFDDPNDPTDLFAPYPADPLLDLA